MSRTSQAKAHDLPLEVYRLARAGDVEARNRIVEVNMPLVISIAKHYRSFGAEIEDLIQEGAKGLMVAAERFDVDAFANEFSTYSVYWITNFIRKGVYGNLSLVRVPYWVAYRSREIQKHGDTFPETMSTAARECIARARAAQREVVSLDGHCDRIACDDLITEPDQDDHLILSERLDALREALATLAPREMDVISRRFGLNGAPRDTLKILGDEMGVSKQMIQNIERSALRKLWIALRDKEAS